MTCLLTIPEGVNVVEDIHQVVRQAEMESVTIDMNNGIQGIDIHAAMRTPIAVTFKRKVIIVFDYDSIVSNNQPFITHITSAMKLGIVPVLLIAQEMTGKAASLPVKHLSVIMAGDEQPEEDEYKITVVYGKRDTFEDKGLLGAKHALQGRTDIDYRGDNIAYGGVYDSYLDSCPSEQAYFIAEAYSWSDVLGDSLYGGAEHDIYSFLPLMTAATVFSTAPKHGKVKTFGIVWSKNNARYAKVKNIQTIQNVMLSLQKRNLTLFDGLDFCRTILTQCVHEKEYHKAARFAQEVGLNAQTLILLMRLWKTKYTLAIHAKVKQHM